MAKFVRVREENGTEKSMPEGVASAAGLKPLDKPARAADGSLLPDKPRVAKGAVQPTTSTVEARPASDRPQEG